MELDDKDYLPPLETWLRDRARLVVCGKANNVRDAQHLLATLGLLDDSRASNSHGIHVPSSPERSH